MYTPRQLCSLLTDSPPLSTSYVQGDKLCILCLFYHDLKLSENQLQLPSFSHILSWNITNGPKVHTNLLQRIPLHLCFGTFFYCLTAEGSWLYWKVSFVIMQHSLCINNIINIQHTGSRTDVGLTQNTLRHHIQTHCLWVVKAFDCITN